MPSSDDFEAFLSTLKEATGKIEDLYFRIASASEDGPTTGYKERTYCYELYHRLRGVIPTHCLYTLSGELTKRGHEIISRKIGEKAPDFAFHVPGYMTDNLSVIEVKRIDTKDDVLKDFKNLRKFLEEAEYKGAIQLVFGTEGGQIGKFQQAATQELGGLTKGTFVLLWHRLAGEPAEEVLRLRTIARADPSIT